MKKFDLIIILVLLSLIVFEQTQIVKWKKEAAFWEEKALNLQIGKDLEEIGREKTFQLY